MTYETFIQSQSPKKYRLLKDVNIPKIRCEQAPCPQSIWKKGDIVMGIFHKAGPSCPNCEDIREARVEIWQESNPDVKYSVSPDKVTEATVLSTMLSSSTTNVEGFFEKPANVAIASVFATLLVISAFNWKKIAQLMK